MAPARTVQVSVPSTTPPNSAFVQPLPQDENTGILTSSSYEPEEVTQTHLAEVRQGMEILREEMQEAAVSATSQQRAFENRITAHLAAMQNTMVQCLVHRQPPPHSTPPGSSSFPEITFGSLSDAVTPPVEATITSFPPLPLPTSTTHVTPPLNLIPVPDLNHLFAQQQQQPNPTNQLPHQPIAANGHPFYRPPKIDLPRFMGDDAIGWFAMAERYIRGQQIPAGERIAILASYFGPTPSLWMNFFEQRNPNATWEQFVAAFLEHFGGSTGSDYKAALSHLQQKTTVDAFISEFTLLACRVPEWSDADLVPMFIGGLKSEIQQDVAVMEPRSLAVAQRIARRYEMKLQDNRPSCSVHPFPWHSSNRQHNPPSATFLPQNQLTNPNSHSLSPSISTPHKPSTDQSSKWWPSSAQRERRNQGLCFHCDEKWSKSHVCKNPVMAILDSLTPCGQPEVEEASDEANDIPLDQDHHLPLHAITNTNVSEMLRFTGTVNGHPINIFVDCGSAMNFLNPEIATKIGCTIAPPGDHRFKTATGQPVRDSGTAQDVTVTIQGYEFVDSFLLMAVTDCDLLLGAQWLDTLGFIGLHFAEKVMAFTANGRCHVLHGIKGRTHELDEQALYAMLSQEQLDDLHSFPKPKLTPLQAHHPKVQQVLESFQDLFTPPTNLPPKRPIDHCIPLQPNTGPINVRPYPYGHSQKNELEAQVREMLSQGIIRPSRSPFSSPVLLVRKKDKTWRFCVDYRAWNAATIKDRFPIPVVDELLDELHGATIFTKLDLRAGYHQVRMNEDDIYKTAFRTHEGHYEFLVMPFGLSNAPSTFQALMNELFKPLLRKGVLVFFDDILIYSKDLESHVRHLEEVFHILRQNLLKLKESKCVFAQPQVQYLGHVISGKGVAADPEKINSLVHWPKPTSVKALRGFLGLAGYYRRLVRHFGTIAKPLTDLLKRNQFLWSPRAEEAFNQLKSAVTTAPVLALPDFSKPFVVETDTCGSGIGAVLSQEKRPVAYLSKALSPSHQTLSTYDKEMMAILFAVGKWRHYLLGNRFTILTDHQTLRHLLTQRISTPSQHRWLSKLLGYDYEIVYQAGSQNTVPDALSRQFEVCAIHSISAPVFDFIGQIDNACLRDPEAQAVVQALKAGQPTKSGFTLCLNRLHYKGRPFVPSSFEWRAKLLYEFHSSLQAGHSGYLRTYERIRRNFAWPGMRRTIKHYIAACDQCQR
ncbi:PREDICTED: uncharacterized protein LOC101299658 [Fragaria vesca subsp. vesca]